MARSSKKGPFVVARLLAKVNKQKASGERTPIKTWSRACQIPPEFVGHKFGVYNGRVFIDVFVNESMVGHRLGEFSPTRTFKSHSSKVEKVAKVAGPAGPPAKA